MTPKYVLTASGDSSIKLWETGNPEHILAHEFRGAHPLGAHHIAVNRNTGTIAASVGYSGEIVLWDLENLKQLHRIETKDQDGMYCQTIRTTVPTKTDGLSQILGVFGP